ncbi:hypothetical protein HCX48_10975 [Rhodocyclus tenuis]|uniref:Uncharacterized protein n=1 Tax=Rhodocyclus gracilis TaxID=2929842 RepID=A0ABX0WJ49_9RHOO|nr:hypothetical protein [Rhodocyclus gracilis]NJA89740.1 hypothetical protein [Rhodocyclus gracilis]
MTLEKGGSVFAMTAETGDLCRCQSARKMPSDHDKKGADSGNSSGEWVSLTAFVTCGWLVGRQGRRGKDFWSLCAVETGSGLLRTASSP